MPKHKPLQIMHHKDTKKVYNALQFAEIAILLAKFEDFQDRLKRIRKESFWIINQMRVITRRINIDTKIPLNLSDTDRREMAMEQAIDEGSPIVDVVLHYQEVVVHQDKFIEEQKIEIERLNHELEKLKNKL